MDNKEALDIVLEALGAAYDLKAELELTLDNIQNPNIPTRISKKKTIRRLRLVNNVIYAGEKARESLEAEIAKQDNPKMRLKRRR